MKAIFTIGFTQKTAEKFFSTLKRSEAGYLLDIRLNNTSQLAGFTKKQDLKYFLKKLADIEYQEIPALAPTDSMLKEYRISENWDAYEEQYNSLLNERHPEKDIQVDWIEKGVVLLCSEIKADKCHRRLAAEYLSRIYGNKIIHL